MPVMYEIDWRGMLSGIAEERPLTIRGSLELYAYISQLEDVVKAGLVWVVAKERDDDDDRVTEAEYELTEALNMIANRADPRADQTGTRVGRMSDDELQEIEREIAVGRRLPGGSRYALDTMARLVAEVRRLRSVVGQMQTAIDEMGDSYD